jgi:O-antigen/teichoic acid export membrane protein
MRTGEFSKTSLGETPQEGSVDSFPQGGLLRGTIQGSRWMLYLSGTALFAGFCTNVVLGRVGPETLGFYGFLMLMVALINTFFVFGGPNILVTFFPRIDESIRPAFIIACATVVFGFGCLLFSLCLLFPSLLELVFGRQLGVPVPLYLAIMLPILLMQFLFWAILQAGLEFKILAVSQNSVSWVNFILVAAMLTAGLLTPAGGAEQRTILLFAVIVANCMPILLGVFYIHKRYTSRWSSHARWYLPEGFWRFALSLHGGAWLNFFIVNAAPLFIVRDLGLRELGYFRAVSILAQFVGWVPMVLDKPFYATVCKLLSTNKPLNHVYERFSRLYMISSSVVALVLLLFSRELLGVFGKSFSDSSHLLLLILCAGSLLSSPIIYLNYALVTAYQKTAQTMGAYAIGAASSVLLFGILVPRFGLVGIGVGYFLLQLVMMLTAVHLANRFTHVSFPLRGYSITGYTLAVGLIGSLVWPVVGITEIVCKLGLAAVFVLLLFRVGLVTKLELVELVEIVMPRGR